MNPCVPGELRDAASRSDMTATPTNPAASPSLRPVPPMKLSGLEPVLIGEGSLFVNIGERTNVTAPRPSPG